MGFAIIRSSNTIAEDALAAVPTTCARLAGLGCDALADRLADRDPDGDEAACFSAVMIGFGRAVGETMIVLMAAGTRRSSSGTSSNGFRTLSANIAVELPEAVRNSTHYRTLFLAALVLFTMTFVLNTCRNRADRFRKKAMEL